VFWVDALSLAFCAGDCNMTMLGSWGAISIVWVSSSPGVHLGFTKSSWGVFTQCALFTARSPENQRGENQPTDSQTDALNALSNKRGKFKGRPGKSEGERVKKPAWLITVATAVLQASEGA